VANFDDNVEVAFDESKTLPNEACLPAIAATERRFVAVPPDPSFVEVKSLDLSAEFFGVWMGFCSRPAHKQILRVISIKH
jgi:alpha-D-ribose 1-methylphosphonate 5-phosphate C-P lyase